MNSMYIIIESNSIEMAKARVKTLMDAKGYPDSFGEFLFGESHEGYANGKTIKNNTVLSDWGNGNFCFEVDCNIVEEYGADIAEEIAKHNDTHWCTAEQVQKYMPKVIV